MSELKINLKTHRYFSVLATILTVLVVVTFLAFFNGLFIEENIDWKQYKSLFVTQQGRVVDTGNNDVSHSESQGWGMLLAVKNDDRATFDQIWRWTQQHLQIRDDKLFAWRWIPTDAAKPVPDMNNASDGDIYIAWALLQAAEQWGESNYADDSVEIIHAIRQQLIQQFAGITVLLPGKEGFVHDDHVVLNFSYWVFPAFEDFKRLDPNPVWQTIRESGIRLLMKAQFGQWNLPPDWAALTLQGDLQLASNFPPRFGYDAIRVPLALYWGQVTNGNLLDPYRNLYQSSHNSSSPLPAWFDLADNSTAPHNANDAFTSILAVASMDSKPNGKLPDFPAISKVHDYYTATLVMLTQQAITEVKQQ